MRRASLDASGARLSGRDNGLRLLEYAIAASLALHLVAFGALQLLTSRAATTPDVPGAINARLVERESPAPSVPSSLSAAPAPAVAAAPAPVAAREPSARQEPALPAHSTSGPGTEPMVVPKPVPRPGPRAKPKPLPAARHPAGTAPSPDALSAGRSALPEAAANSSGQASVLARTAPPPAAGSAASALDEDVLARYRTQLIGAARRYKRYPRAAMDNQWEGAAEVAMLIDAHGKIREMTISSSSGHTVLDQQAIDMFRKAKPLVPIPAALRGREFRVTLKAIYSLRDPGA